MRFPIGPSKTPASLEAHWCEEYRLGFLSLHGLPWPHCLHLFPPPANVTLQQIIHLGFWGSKGQSPLGRQERWRQGVWRYERARPIRKKARNHSLRQAGALFDETAVLFNETAVLFEEICLLTAGLHGDTISKVREYTFWRGCVGNVVGSNGGAASNYRW